MDFLEADSLFRLGLGPDPVAEWLEANRGRALGGYLTHLPSTIARMLDDNDKIETQRAIERSKPE